MSSRSRIVHGHPARRHRNQLLCVAAIAAVVASCTDQPTAPSSVAVATAAANAGPFDLNSAAATLEWQATGRGLVAAHAVSPLVAGRAYALLGVSQYGAAVAADDGYDGKGGGRALYEARRGAIAGASASILSYLFPDAAAALASQVASDGNEGPGDTHPAFTQGVATGQAMAARMAARAATDGFNVAWNHQPPPDPLGGGWVGLPNVAPAGFQFPKVQPYYMTSQDQFRPGPPAAVGTPAFAADLDAVRAAQAARTPDDIAFANF